MKKRFNIFFIWLNHPRLILVLACLAILLTLPCLKIGYLMDDYSQQGRFLGKFVSPVQDASLFGQFSFLKGNTEINKRLMDVGLLPWWTYQGLKLNFWRPLTEITHWLDYRLWPNMPSLMHLQSMLWFAGLVMILTVYYRKINGLTWVAGLAALLYTIDHTHSMPVGWLANRNAIIAAFFGVLTLLSHNRWQKAKWQAGIIISPFCLCLGLLSGESGIATGAYLFSYAVFIDTQSFSRRLFSLLPYGVVVAGWWILYHKYGFGSTGSGMYLDPVRETAYFLKAIFYRLPVLLQGQFGVVPAQIYGMVPDYAGRLMWGGNVIFLIIAGIIFYPLLRQDGIARFWTLGMLLSLIPVCATFPDNRLLMFVSIGASGLLARFLGVLWENADQVYLIRFWRGAARALAGVFVLIHLILSPFSLSINAWLLAGRIGQIMTNPLIEIKLEPDIRQDISTVPEKLNYTSIFKAADIRMAEKDLILVNPPVAIFASYLPTIRFMKGMTIPPHTRILASGLYALEIKRIDDKTLVIQPEHGHMANDFDKIYRGDAHPMQIGQTVELTGMTVEVLTLTQDLRPNRTSYRFDVALEDTGLKWMRWDSKKRGYVVFELPDIGERIVLAGTVSVF